MDIHTKYELHQTVKIRFLTDVNDGMGRSGDISATILKVEFSGFLMYYISYWYSGDLRYCWCFEDEIGE
jgi:hypothetical protein